MKCLPGEVVGVRVGGVVSTAPVDTDPDVAPGRGGPGAGVGDDGFDISSAKPSLDQSLLLLVSFFCERFNAVQSVRLNYLKNYPTR